MDLKKFNLSFYKVTDQFDQPLVSIIISNYNYASYLERCVDSVLSQTYDLIECIIVDDKSTDDSANTLNRIQAAHKNITIIRRAENGGQSAAALDGLKQASGSYVIFLDADDVLLPHAVACHVYAHVSMRIPVGFTCADMLQVGGNILMGTSSLPLTNFITTHADRKFQQRSATSEIIPLPPAVPSELLDRIYLVEPWDTGWVWSATSAMMFRRDALRFWENTPDFVHLRYSIDAFFCYGINAICGSAIIDMPLAAYRIHGHNGFAARIPLNHVRSYELNSQGERSIDALKLLLKQAQEQKSYYRGLFWSEKQYHSLLKTLKTTLTIIQEANETEPPQSLSTSWIIFTQKLYQDFRKWWQRFC
ncbi:glycosyltransferase family 2 protein [Beijerinckia indica]|uniref:Glycosyl transferase family 2 n=1 Tax=Beijerinckia indica subsp. indica (strain ATCC 9039 / DSM 1715 / NCIMB 8712) TaxID=395963 RepID=B2IAY4_BEII9|nr:glycosyltransferase family 2 protein [Beijerinckia indica]ACB93684.1 glycosyl transferase family 2 [Beijerinckia indica subsp. indica ATCC 9039]